MIIYLASYLYAPVVIVNAIVYMLLCKLLVLYWVGLLLPCALLQPCRILATVLFNKI